MGRSEVVIIGGGLAGATAAAMLGRAGIATALIDPHSTYPDDFRCEKFDESQLELLRATGLGDAVLPQATPITELWVARRGRLVERSRTSQFAFDYPGLVNAMRAAMPPRVTFLKGKVVSLATSDDEQVVHLADGSEIRARLVVMASGLNSGLRASLGMSHDVLSPAHSISAGFDTEATTRPFRFPALTYYPETVEARIAYLTLFPVGTGMRANLFCYRDLRDPWLKALRADPRATLLAAMPGLEDFTGDFTVTGAVKIRPVDLYATGNHLKPGIVLVGDAFSTACPAAGTGASKALTDVERLCAVHIPEWLKTPGMGLDKIGMFYRDPVKRRCDADSARRARNAKSLATDTGAPWRARRFVRFTAQAARGLAREAVERVGADGHPPGPTAAPSET